MRKYVTISVPAEAKDLLERAKGEDEWGKFLLKLYAEVKRLKSKEAFEELADLLTDEDLKAIIESSREFREEFAFR